MRDAEAFDIAEDFECVETGHDYICGAESKHGERDYSGGVREWRDAEADGIGAFTAPVVGSHFRHRAPGKAGDADAFGWSGSAAGGNEAYETIGIAEGVGPLDVWCGAIIRVRAALHEFF